MSSTDLTKLSASGKLASLEAPDLKRILVIDDNDNERQMMVIKLNNTHASIDVASNLETAYALVRENKPDAILLDVGIMATARGGMANVSDVLSFVRFHKEHHCMVMITGNETAKDYEVQEFYNAGAMDYIYKDRIYVDQELVVRVREAFRLFWLLRENVPIAQFLLKVSHLKSDQDKIYGSVQRLELGFGKVRDAELALAKKQAFDAGHQSALEKVAKDRSWKKVVNRAAAVGGGLTGFAVLAWEVIKAFWEGYRHVKE